MRHLSFYGILLLCSLLFPAPVFGLGVETERYYYGFEMNGTVVGYVEIAITPPAEPGEPQLIETVMFVKMTLLGQDFDVRSNELYRVDSETGRVVYLDKETSMGTTITGSEVFLEEGEARVTFKPEGKTSTVALGPDVQVDDSVHFDYLLRDLPVERGESRKYRIFNFDTGKIDDVSYIRLANEDLVLEGGKNECAVFDMEHIETGMTSKVWVSLDSGRIFRATLPNNSVFYRASPAVVGKIKRAELNDILLAPVNVAIADFQSITSMTVKARVKALGERVTPSSLNVPGQKFTGTVIDGLVEGVFEINHRRYHGKDAPTFPAESNGDKVLAEFLSPERQIESDDAVLGDFARELTHGSVDAWEAACKLSKWVAEEIRYEIPGGSARSTFDARKGECGSHSRLHVAFCRSVGIPARLVTGCMYAPNYGGTFGQHAWTEVYMGKAGWIPVDSTAHEVDYVDCGHIRFGTATSFNPEKMEILDYKASSLEGTTPGELGSFTDLPWKEGGVYTYHYSSRGTSIGTDSFTVKKIEEKEGRTVTTCTTEFLMGAKVVRGNFQIDERGRPVSYRVGGKVGTVEYSVDCAFSADTVQVKVVQTGRPDVQQTIALPETVYLLDNNNFSGYAFLLAAAPLRSGASFSFKAFHPSSMQLLPVQVTVSGREAIEVSGETHECWVCDLVIAGTPLKLWVDDQGRVLRESEGGGRLIVELALDG